MQTDIKGRVILTDVEKSIDIKVLTQYLTITKAMDSIIRFSKVNDKFCIQFKSQQEAQAFLWERAFNHQIIKRKMNLYFAIFDENDTDFQSYILNGLDQEILRKCFEICWAYGACRMVLKQEGQKKSIKGTVRFIKNTVQESKKSQLIQGLKEIGVTLGQLQQNEDQFMCSIQLLNWDKTQKIDIDMKEKLRLQDNLKIFMMKISEKKLKNCEIKSFLHHQSIPMIKAYIKYDTVEDTFEVFEKLRTYLLDMPSQITCRIFYFSREANTFQTLFTKGLQIPQNTSQKHFQNQLIQSFRKITPNVVQILLKECTGKIWTGKIYLKDEQSGKQLACDYLQKRGLICKHYKDKNKISINIFQDKQAMNQIRKQQNNTERMLEHIRNTHERQKQMAPVLVRQDYCQRPQQFRQQYRRRDRQQDMPQYTQKRQVKMRYKPKEEQFPSI